MKILASNLIVLGSFLINCITKVSGFECPCRMQDIRCDTDPPTDCEGGLVFDACGCCQVCGKIIGEVCGGPFFQFCDEGLICKQPPDAEKTQEEGVCIAGRPRKVGETCGPRQQGKCKHGLYCDQISPGNVGTCKKKELRLHMN